MIDRSQYGDTILLPDLQVTTSAKVLTRIHFNRPGSSYNEAWLQKLIMSHPGVLPVSQIEPAFSNMVPVCTELPMRAGFVDNLFVTPTGDIALIECKLWRNPEARRKVLAQIIDYASEMTTWNYELLESAIRRTRSLGDTNGSSSRNLFQIVQAFGEMDEVAFHDAVSRNLKRGRFLLLIVGDGIHEGLETMTEFLQQHAGLHFTLSIVELALFEVSTGSYIAQPRVLARTTNIDRGVVTLTDSRMDIAAAVVKSAVTPVRGTTITQEHFFEDLEQNSPGVSENLRSFVANFATCNIQPEYGAKTLTLRWHLEDSRNWNLGTIINSGEVWLDYHGQQARSTNLLDASKEYLESLAELVPGASVRKTKSGAWNIAGADGHSLRIESLLADDIRREGWIRAIMRFQIAVAGASEDSMNFARIHNTVDAQRSIGPSPEVVLEIGYEGGSQTVLRVKRNDDWEFLVECDETAAYDLFSEEDTEGLTLSPISERLETFPQVLEALDRRQWALAHPIRVHRDYAEEILTAVRRRLSYDSPESSTMDLTARSLAVWEQKSRS